eukprot:TRINITY_DN1206_c0_g1_i1.p1 TRINITY_DN1206_c0_g1~~TRINITY_DN1206_c0_g1_i1.p1  ORF type:complete len:1083 (-),score=239.40 TRINITY_DN1206_c0_g1_i1:96-3290(-)
MASEQITIEQWQELLKLAFVPDTQTIRDATTLLNKHLKHHHSIIQLSQILNTSPSLEIRQLSAVLIRKKIVGHWRKLTDEFKQQFQEVLPQILLKEPSNLVRNSIADLISVVARISVPFGTWNELLVFLFKCTQSPQPEHREIAMKLFYSLTDTIPDTLRPHFQTLHQLFLLGLQDQNDAVRLASLKSVGVLFEWLTDTEYSLMTAMLPPMVQVIRYCLEKGYTDDILTAFEVFESLLEQEIPPLMQILPDLVRFILETARNNENDMAIRQKALNFIEEVAEFHSKVLIKNNFIPPILEALFSLCSEAEEEEDIMDQLSSHRFSAQTLLRLTECLPRTKIFPPTQQIVEHYLKANSLPEKRAALTFLGVLAEGCTEQFIEKLPEMLPYVCSGFVDQNLMIREASCMTLAQFATYLQPDILEHTQTLLPLLLQALGDTNSRVQVKCCYALEQFCENMAQSDIAPYAELLMSKLVPLMQFGPRQVQEIVVSAIASTASAMEESFLPYFELVIGMLRQVLSRTDTESILYRSRSIEAVGVIAIAVGRQVFQPYINTLMELSLRSCTDDFEYREETMHFFSNIATLLKEDFAVFLPNVMEFVFSSCDSEEGIIHKDAEDESLPGIEKTDDDELDSPALNYSVHTSFLSEKALATQALGHIASCVGRAFLPYLERSVTSLEHLSSYFHDEVRDAAMTSLQQIVEVVDVCFPREQKWTKGVMIPLQPQTKLLLDKILGIYLTTIRDDEDAVTVASALEAIGKICKTLGPVALADCVMGVIAVLKSVFDQELPCQKRSSEDEVAEEGDDKDIELFNSATEMLVELVKSAGVVVLPAILPLFPCLSKYSAASFPAGFRSIAIGTIAEIAGECGSSFAPYFNEYYPLVQSGVQDKDRLLRRNAIYCLGVLIQCLPPSSPNYISVCTDALRSFGATITHNKEDAAVLDNAAGALARILLSTPQGLLPNLHPENCLQLIFSALPLKNDFEPYSPIFNCFFRLLEEEPTLAGQFIGQIVTSFCQALGHKELDSDVQTRVVSILRSLSEKFSAQMQSIFMSLPPDQLQNIKQYLSSE